MYIVAEHLHSCVPTVCKNTLDWTSSHAWDNASEHFTPFASGFGGLDLLHIPAKVLAPRPCYVLPPRCVLSCSWTPKPRYYATSLAETHYRSWTSTTDPELFKWSGLRSVAARVVRYPSSRFTSFWSARRNNKLLRFKVGKDLRKWTLHSQS